MVYAIMEGVNDVQVVSYPKTYMNNDCTEEQFVSCVQKLPHLENNRRPDAQEQEDHVLDEGDNQNGQNVEFISRKVVVQEVTFSPIGH